jgi:long-chain acyl-CoA synthetase
MAEKIAAAMDAFVRQLLGPGGDFEIGPDKWLVGGKPVEFRCFKGAKHTPAMGEFYARHMAGPENHDKEFIVFERERYTFGQVYAQAAALAHVLQATFAVEKGDRVCIAMRNYPEWCVAFIAATAIGAVAVPVNGWWVAHELEYGLEDSGSRVLICDKDRHDRAANCLRRLGIRALSVRCSISGVASYERLVGAALAAAKPMPVVDVHTDDPAAMMYTSGTTGHPKGVVQTHRGITNQMTLVRAEFPLLLLRRCCCCCHCCCRCCRRRCRCC